MTDQDRGYTAEQAAAANAVLRGALGLPPQRFEIQQFVGMISDEIEQLRSAGKSDDDIANLLSQSAGVEISAQSIARFYAEPEQHRPPS